MKIIITIGLLLCMASYMIPIEDSTLRTVLLEQLRNTHTHQDWFIPTNEALVGLTSEQAIWKDSTRNHSILELVSHLAFWNDRILTAFQGDVVPDFYDDNEITFMTYAEGGWNHAMQKLASVQAAWQLALKNSQKGNFTNGVRPLPISAHTMPIIRDKSSTSEKCMDGGSDIYAHIGIS